MTELFQTMGNMDSIDIGLWVTGAMLVFVLLGVRVAFAAATAGFLGLVSLRRVFGQKRLRQVLIGNRPQETPDRHRADRCRAEIRRSRVGAGMDHGV